MKLLARAWLLREVGRPSRRPIQGCTGELSRRCEPDSGRAFWSLPSNLAFRFKPTPDLRGDAGARLAQDTLSSSDRTHLEFALGKARRG